MFRHAGHCRGELGYARAPLGVEGLPFVDSSHEGGEEGNGEEVGGGRGEDGGDHQYGRGVLSSVLWTATLA